MRLAVSSCLWLLLLVSSPAAEAAKKKENGQRCTADAGCKSDRCRPGPSHQLGDGHSYCMAADRKCALPSLDGADLGTKVYLGDTELVCRDPKQFGRHPQFYRAQE